MDLVPTRRNLALALLSSRKFEVNQILISDKQLVGEEGERESLVRWKCRVGVIHEAVEMNVECTGKYYSMEGGGG